MNFSDIIKYFKSWGFSVSESTDPLLLLLCIIVILTIVACLCVFNILIYGGVVYMFEDKQRLERFTKILPPFLMYILNIYKTTRLLYIVYEVLLLLVCLLSIIWLGGRVIVGVLL